MEWFDDFGELENEDLFENESEQDPVMDECGNDESEADEETHHPESEVDDFTARDAFFLGSAIGFGYEEGLRERKRRKRKRFSDGDSE